MEALSRGPSLGVPGSNLNDQPLLFQPPILPQHGGAGLEEGQGLGPLPTTPAEGHPGNAPDGHSPSASGDL